MSTPQPTSTDQQAPAQVQATASSGASGIERTEKVGPSARYSPIPDTRPFVEVGKGGKHKPSDPSHGHSPHEKSLLHKRVTRSSAPKSVANPLVGGAPTGVPPQQVSTTLYVVGRVSDEGDLMSLLAVTSTIFGSHVRSGPRLIKYMLVQVDEQSNGPSLGVSGPTTSPSGHPGGVSTGLVEYVLGFASETNTNSPPERRAEQKLAAICNALLAHNTWLESIPVSDRDLLLRNCSLEHLDKVTSAICEIAEWFEGCYNRRVPTSESIIVGSRRVEQIASLAVTGSSDALQRIENQIVATHSLLKTVGKNVDSIRVESGPSYAHPTKSSAAKARPSRAMSVDPMEVSEAEGPRTTSAQPSRPATSEKRVRLEVPKKQQSKVTPETAKTPSKPLSRFAQDAQRARDRRQEAKGKAKATPADASDSETEKPSGKRPRSPVSRPTTPSTAAPERKKARTGELTSQETEDLQTGYKLIDTRILQAIPADERQALLIDLGKKHRIEAASSQPPPPPPPKSNPANASGAGQGKTTTSSKGAKPKESASANARPAPKKPAQHHQPGPASRPSVQVNVMFDVDVPEKCRLLKNSAERLMTNLLNSWERKFTPDQVAGTVVRNICTDVQWAGARDLRIEFSCRVPTEFLVWLQEQAWIIETYFPSGLNGPNGEASMGEFVKWLPYDLNKFMHTDVETGVTHLDPNYPKPVRVWHFVQLLRIVIRGVPCYASASDGDGAEITKKDKAEVTRAIADVYQELCQRLSPDVLDLIVPFGNNPKATWHGFTVGKRGSHATVHCSAFDYAPRGSTWNKLQAVRFAMAGAKNLCFALDDPVSKGLMICGRCHRANHATKSCPSLNDAWCSKCVGNHATHLHDQYALCCMGEREKTGVITACPESHWYCCNCGGIGHSSEDRKCPFRRHSQDLAYLKRHENYGKHAPGPAVTCVDGRNSYKKLYNKLRALCSKKMFDEATTKGQSDLELPEPHVPMEIGDSTSRQGSVAPGPSQPEPGPSIATPNPFSGLAPVVEEKDDEMGEHEDGNEPPADAQDEPSMEEGEI